MLIAPAEAYTSLLRSGGERRGSCLEDVPDGYRRDWVNNLANKLRFKKCPLRDQIIYPWQWAITNRKGAL